MSTIKNAFRAIPETGRCGYANDKYPNVKMTFIHRKDKLYLNRIIN